MALCFNSIHFLLQKLVLGSSVTSVSCCCFCCMNSNIFLWIVFFILASIFSCSYFLSFSISFMYWESLLLNLSVLRCSFMVLRANSSGLAALDKLKKLRPPKDPWEDWELEEESSLDYEWARFVKLILSFLFESARLWFVLLLLCFEEVCCGITSDWNFAILNWAFSFFWVTLTSSSCLSKSRFVLFGPS